MTIRERLEALNIDPGSIDRIIYSTKPESRSTEEHTDLIREFIKQVESNKGIKSPAGFLINALRDPERYKKIDRSIINLSQEEKIREEIKKYKIKEERQDQYTKLRHKGCTGVLVQYYSFEEIQVVLEGDIRKDAIIEELHLNRAELALNPEYLKVFKELREMNVPPLQIKRLIKFYSPEQIQNSIEEVEGLLYGETHRFKVVSWDKLPKRKYDTKKYEHIGREHKRSERAEEIGESIQSAMQGLATKLKVFPVSQEPEPLEEELPDIPF